MATFDPPPDLFARQLESIRAQTYRNWVCILSDDCSAPERFAALREAVGDDPRFVISAPGADSAAARGTSAPKAAAAAETACAPPCP